MKDYLEYLHGTTDEKEFLEMDDLLPLSDAIKACEIAEREIAIKATLAHRELCNSYKVSIRYECGNYSHRQNTNQKKCDMTCEYMRYWFEKFPYQHLIKENINL